MFTIGYFWEEYEKFWFFIMCHDWRYVSGHSLLKPVILIKAKDWLNFWLFSVIFEEKSVAFKNCKSVAKA